MSDRVERRLAAILAADVVGYSRLIGADETGTIRAVRDLQTEILEPVLEAHGGRMVKTMGDGFLMEFASAVAGVEAATEVQRRLGERGAETTGDRTILLRIGLHVGDIVIEAGDIFGEGVNIAARIEPLVRPGGVGISDDAYRQVRDRLDLAWEDHGEHEVRNIARPIRIWQWSTPTTRRPAPTDPVETPEQTLLPLPDKPSVAVLPFDNMSGDPEQAFFADGMTEDLITDLSKISGLFVVARNSTFGYRGQPVDIPAIARRLGVRHVIEGSVRKAGSRVRINVQLIDASSGGHVWADRFDGSLDAVFELQDDVCAKVVSALSVPLTQEEAGRAKRVHTRNVDAYELYVQARATPYPPVPERIQAARTMFEKVVAMAPDFAGGYAGLSWIAGFGALWGHGGPTQMGLEAERLAHEAIEADDSFGWSYSVLGLACLTQRRFAEAVDCSARSLELLPNDADAHAFHALITGMSGDRVAALSSLDAAIRLNPHFINGPYLNIRSHMRFLDGDYPGAIASHEENIARGGPVGPPALCWAAASYHAVGRRKEAGKVAAILHDRFPNFTLNGWNFLDILATEAERDRVGDLMRRGIGS